MFGYIHSQPKHVIGSENIEEKKREDNIGSELL